MGRIRLRNVLTSTRFQTFLVNVGRGTCVLPLIVTGITPLLGIAVSFKFGGWVSGVVAFQWERCSARRSQCRHLPCPNPPLHVPYLRVHNLWSHPLTRSVCLKVLRPPLTTVQACSLDRTVRPLRRNEEPSPRRICRTGTFASALRTPSSRCRTEWWGECRVGIRGECPLFKSGLATRRGWGVGDGSGRINKDAGGCAVELRVCVGVRCVLRGLFERSVGGVGAGARARAEAGAGAGAGVGAG